MKRRAAVFVGLTTALLLLHCMESAEVTVDETEVRARNRLLNVRLPDGSTVDSVHIHGLQVGDLRFELVRAGATTGSHVTDRYGEIGVTVDSLELVAWRCLGDTCGWAYGRTGPGGPYYTAISRYDTNLVTVDTNLVPF